MKLILLLSSMLLLISSCSAGKEKIITIEGKTMGTYYRVKALTNKDPKDLKVKIDKFFKLFNLVFSTYIPESELSKINSGKYDSHKVTDTLKKMLILSTMISKKSQGYFDVTVGPLVNVWGFGPGQVSKMPTQAKIDEIRKYIGFEKYELDDNILKLNDKRMYLDFSAIAKGFGIDELIIFLDYSGISNLLVEVGGEVRGRGYKDTNKKIPWTVGIEGPSDTLGKKIKKVVRLYDMSLATSGSYRNFKKYGNKVFQHTMNPLTGRPAEHRTISVSVINEHCADADAWATALMSMGAKKGLEIAKQNDIIAFFQVKEGIGIKTYETKSFTNYMNKTKGTR